MNLLSRRLRIPEEVSIRKLDGESVLLNMKNETYYGLDIVGTRCWDLLLASATVREASRQVAEEYGIDVQQAETDIVVFAESLLVEGLLVDDVARNVA